ncbi:MAG TPA: GC-type dockerin domain-anchored protein [Phycisphaerales bacterium]|nr:GC-type dockerin domain-anchored protein [Phycisphaerales bacterium]
MPADGKGSNAYFLADFFDGQFFCLAEFSCHFMLWGTSQGGGIPDRPGISDWQQQDGEQGGCGVPMHGTCYDYGLGCPDPLANMIVFWGVPGDPLPCPVDCNNDRVLDSRDLFCFLNLYAAGDAAADCNGDTAINSLDVMCFLDLFRYPPCP